jgi:membrane protein implicated in regulation of membrane protease activity
LLVFPSVPPGAQGVVFGALSLIALIAWRRHRRTHPARPIHRR